MVQSCWFRVRVRVRDTVGVRVRFTLGLGLRLGFRFRIKVRAIVTLDPKPQTLNPFFFVFFSILSHHGVIWLAGRLAGWLVGLVA